MTIGNRAIGVDEPVFVIAELSGNHNHSLERALELVAKAARCGASAVKIQTYTPDTITFKSSEPDFVVANPTSLWHGRTLYDLYAEAALPYDWHRPIFDRARDLGIECFSSPFDETAVDFLEQFEPAAYKIASPEIVHVPLIKRVAQTGKPVIISTGMASAAEIDLAVGTAREHGATNVALLKCTSSYPADARESNVTTIHHMRALFSCEVGLSDHTPGVGAACSAVALGATLVEKHFTLRRADGGVDSAFSLEPSELSALVVETERARLAVGSVTYGPAHSERASLSFRRSVYAVHDIKPGDVISRHNTRVIRPANGLAPRYFEVIQGMIAQRTVGAGTPLHWDDLIKDR